MAETKIKRDCIKLKYNINTETHHSVAALGVPPHGSNRVNPSIPSKHKQCTRFGWTLMNYSFYVITYQSGGEGHGNKHTYVMTDR